MLAYGLATLDNICDSMPLDAAYLQPLQRAADACITAALQLPRGIPKAVLHTPASLGGFGAPHLATRCSLRYIASIYKASRTRSTFKLASSMTPAKVQ